MNKVSKSKIFKILILILVIAIFTAVTIYMFPIIKNISTPEGRLEFKDMIQSSGFKGMLTLFLLQFAQIFLFILPGEPIEIIAGMCYGGLGGTIFLIVSSTLITMLIFFLVQKFGTRFVYSFCDEEKIQKIQNSKLFQNPKKIEIVMFILFFIPGTPKDLLVYIAGLLPIKFHRFIIISTIARIPSIISSTYAGQNILNGNYKNAALVYAVIVLIAFIIIFIFNKLDKDKTTEEAMKIIK